MVGLNVVRGSKTRLWVQCVPSSAATGGGRESPSQACGRWRPPVPGACGRSQVAGGTPRSPELGRAPRAPSLQDAQTQHAAQHSGRTVLRPRGQPAWPLPGSDRVLGTGEGGRHRLQEKRPHRGGTGAPVQGWLPAWEGDVPANPSGRWANQGCDCGHTRPRANSRAHRRGVQPLVAGLWTGEWGRPAALAELLTRPCPRGGSLRLLGACRAVKDGWVGG